MGRKMIIVSDENEFIVSAKAFCESKGGTVKTYSTTEWSRQVNTPGFAHTLVGGVPPLSTGNHPLNEGAKILQFPHGGQGGTGGTDSRVATMNELESVAIQNAIQSYNGNLTEAAKALGIGRATLYRKVKQYNIDPSTARRKKAA
jgi:transcriptional regulator of acetoin/glycerol metabolism